MDAKKASIMLDSSVCFSHGPSPTPPFHSSWTDANYKVKRFLGAGRSGTRRAPAGIYNAFGYKYVQSRKGFVFHRPADRLKQNLELLNFPHKITRGSVSIKSVALAATAAQVFLLCRVASGQDRMWYKYIYGRCQFYEQSAK